MRDWHIQHFYQLIGLRAALTFRLLQGNCLWIFCIITFLWLFSFLSYRLLLVLLGTSRLRCLNYSLTICWFCFLLVATVRLQLSHAFVLAVLFRPPLLNLRKRSWLAEQAHECGVSVQFSLEQEDVDTLIILNLIDQLQKLKKSKHGIKAEAKRHARILSVHSLVNAELDEAVVIYRPPNNHNLLNIKRLRGNLKFAELILYCLIHLLSHLTRQPLLYPLLVQILHRKRILFRQHALVEIWWPNFKSFLQEIDRYKSRLQLRLQFLGNLEKHFVLIDSQHDILFKHFLWLNHRKLFIIVGHALNILEYLGIECSQRMVPFIHL